ncbi:MAG: transmembrane sensor [Candidatus Latescibacterota bacterium]|jgi:transmembrane sensor
MMELDKLLHKYLEGNATSDEMERLKSDTQFATYVRISEKSATFKTPDFNKESTLKAISEHTIGGPKVKQINPVHNLLKFAALIAVIIASFVLITSLDTTIHTDTAQKESIKLPDASEVLLNANSELVYNKGNWDNERLLKLNGEAYFKVSKGNTFSVKTSQGTVTVLGTEFNVFSRDTIFNIACYEGLVSIQFDGQTIKLPAGNKLKIENSKIVLNVQSTSLRPVWTENESSFDNDALSTVLNELRAQYPINITAPTYINTKRFTGSFTHTNLENALRAICAPLQLEFTIDSNQVRIYAESEE